MTIWIDDMKLEDLAECSECLSLYLKNKSSILALCPECGHKKFGHKNCSHEFASSRCIHCYWDGSNPY